MSGMRSFARPELALALVVLMFGPTGSALAQMSSRSSGGQLGSSSSRGSSSRGLSSSRSSRSSQNNNDQTGGDNSDGSGNSRNSRSRSSRSSSSRGSSTHKSSSRGTSSGKSSSSEPPPLVFGTKYERAGVHPRGELLSAATFKTMHCDPQSVGGDATAYYRCGDAWYQRIEQEGWTCYSEIWPPAGASISSLPSDYTLLQAGGRTLYATPEAWYERRAETGEYVVVEPPVGLQVDRIPNHARDGIPVVSNGVTYYRHLGVFYRQEDEARAPSYKVAASPFDAPVEAPGATVVAPIGTPATNSPAQGSSSATPAAAGIAVVNPFASGAYLIPALAPPPPSPPTEQEASQDYAPGDAAEDPQAR